MKATVEKLENARVKLEIEVEPERVATALDRAYRKVVKDVNVPGFRKGRVPRPVLERMYGVGVLYEDAIEDMVPEAYDAAVTENGLEPIDQPEINVIEIEPGKPFRFSAEVQLKPEVKLGEYKGVSVTRRLQPVTDEMIDEVIERYRESLAQLVEPDRTVVEQGDFVRIDFEGYKDGVPFAGGAAKDFTLEIGSGQFIDGFEEQLIGATVGETLEVNVTFPEEYHSQELAGKPAVFKVTVHGIKVKELPELDGEFVKDVSDKETLAELRDEIRENLEKEFKRQADSAVRDELVDIISDRCEVDIPHVMVHRESHGLVHEFLHDLSHRGVNPDTYLESNGLSFADLEEQFESQAERRVKYALVIEAIGKAEGIEVTQEEIDKRIDEMVGETGSDAYRQQLNQPETRDRLESSLQVTKIIDFLVEHADITDEVVQPGSESEEPESSSQEAPETDAAPETEMTQE